MINLIINMKDLVFKMIKYFIKIIITGSDESAHNTLLAVLFVSLFLRSFMTSPV